MLLCFRFPRTCSDSLWGVSQPSKALWTVSGCFLISTSHSQLLLCTWHLLIHYGSLLVSTINFYLMCECSMIHFGVSHNLVRCSGQSLVACLLMLFYIRFSRVHSDSLWGVLQPSKAFQTVSWCIQAVPGLLPDSLWGVSQPSKAPWTVSHCHLFTPLNFSLSTSHSHLLWTLTPFHLLDSNIGEYNLFLPYIWTLCDLLWGVSQPSKVFWTVMVVSLY